MNTGVKNSAENRAKLWENRCSLFYYDTVSSKIFRALEIIPVKNSYLMQFYELNICQDMIFRLYAVYNKHGMIKIGNQTREKISCIIASAPIILLPTVIFHFFIYEVKNVVLPTQYNAVKLSQFD